MTRSKWRLARIIALIVIAGTAIIAFGVNYFSVKEFYLNEHKYRVVEEDQQKIRYTSKTGPAFIVKKNGTDRSITLDGEPYLISVRNQGYARTYVVQFPNEKTFKVIEENKYMLMAFDEQDQWVTGFTIYMNNLGQVTRFGEERYHPSDLVVAAYPQYQQHRGNPVLYYFSIVLFIFGWSSFRYESFQKAMFWASLKWIWTENPEPSDFYFFMSKISGILMMVLSFALWLKSLFNDFELPL